MDFKAHLIEKLQGLIGVYYQLYSNGANYLKTIWTSWTFLNLNPDKVYNMTISVLELILLIVSSQKLANLSHL